MHRIVVFLTVSAAALCACGGGGSVLSFQTTSTGTQTIVSVQAPLNLARVLPGGSLALSAVQVSGSSNGFVSSNRFVWSATLTSGSQYPTSSGQTKPCATVTKTAGGATTTYTGDLSIDITIDPTNEANVLFGPPPVLPPPAGATSVQVSYPYCVLVTAAPVTSAPGAMTLTTGPSGSILVAVVDPLNPLQ